MDYIRRCDYGPNPKIIFIIRPTENAKEFGQHLDLMSETILRNLGISFSTLDYKDPELIKAVQPFDYVFLCGKEVANKFIQLKKLREVLHKDFYGEFGKPCTVIESPAHFSKKSMGIIRVKIQGP